MRRQSLADVPADAAPALKKHEPGGADKAPTGRKLYKKRDFWYAVRYGFGRECVRRKLSQTGKRCRCGKLDIR